MELWPSIQNENKTLEVKTLLWNIFTIQRLNFVVGRKQENVCKIWGLHGGDYE
jgi:hypothetical protein